MHKKIIQIHTDKNSKRPPLQITIFNDEKNSLSTQLAKIERKIEIEASLLDIFPILGIFSINIFMTDLADHRPGLNFHYKQIVNGKRSILLELISRIKSYRTENGISGAMPNFYASLRQLPHGDIEYNLFEI